MARQRDPRREEAFNIYMQHNGDITNRAIADQLNLPEKTVGGWKSKDSWKDKLFGETNGVLQSSERSNPIKERSTPKKAGAPRGNKNAKNNKGGPPHGNKNAVGYGAPSNNLNALKTGEFVSPALLLGLLDDKEKAILEPETTDPFYIIDKEIKELSYREWYMTKLIKKIEDGLSKPQRQLLYQLQKKKYDDIEVEEEDKEMQLIQIQETEYRPIGEILNIQAALDRVTDKLLKATKQKHDMAVSFEHKRWMDKEKLKLDRERLEFQMKQHSLKSGEGGESDEDKQYDITQEIIENNPSLIDAIFKRGLANRGSPGEPDGV